MCPIHRVGKCLEQASRLIQDNNFEVGRGLWLSTHFYFRKDLKCRP